MPANNTGTIRGVIKVCGLYVYPITVVLLPAATLDEIPAELGAGGDPSPPPPALRAPRGSRWRTCRGSRSILPGPDAAGA